MDRSKRLREALPEVTKALGSEKVFHDESGSIWTNLRRGLNDLKKDPQRLDTMELPYDSTIHDVWEFTLDLMVKHPKYSRQILDAAEMLLGSERWANGFLQVKQKHRLSLWKLNATKENEPSPVSVASQLIQQGVKVDDLIPEAALESGLGFVQELASALKGDARSEFDKSQLGTAFREAKAAKAEAAPSPLPEGTSAEDLGELTANNQAQAASIAAAGVRGEAEKRPGCRKEIGDSLLEVFEEAVEVTGKHLEPLLTGYTGEANIASSARARLQELKYRQANLQAQLVVMGPCQVGKTSLTYALAGFAALPPAMPSMVMTKWVHTPGLMVPRMTMPPDLAQLLTAWSERLVRLPHATEIEVLTFHDYVEGVDAVAAAMDACHRTIYRGRTLGVISTEDLAGLSRSTMFLQVEVAFTTLADLEEQLTDTGMLSLVDLPSPEKDTLWATQDLLTLYHSTLRDADGVLVVVDASKYEVPQWMGNMLRSVFKQEEGDFEERSAALQPSDAWIVANRMDQLPEFFCKDGSKELCKKVMERQYENYKDVIVDQEHVIPIAARLSSLAIYGKEKIQEPISQHLARLERQPWFAQACALLFGIRWADQVKEVDQSRWRSSMRELMLLGQVTGTLANSVLKTAYVNMLPRSVARVMQELSQLAWSFCSALNCLEGTSSEIQVKTLSEVFTTYQEDVRQRILKKFREFAPSPQHAEELVARKCPADGMTFDGPDATDLNQKFFEIMAREALAEYQPSYDRAKMKCHEEVKEAHNKFLRTVDYYLTKDGLDPFTKQKLLMDAKNLNLNPVLGALGSPLVDSKRDEFVAEEVKKVEPIVQRRLFHRSHRSYHITLEFAGAFETKLLELWRQAAEELLVKLCLEPIHQSFKKMRQEMEDFNKRPRRRKDNGRCNVSFGPKLAEVLKEICTFNAPMDTRSNDAVSINEAERCERVCQEVRATLQKIR